MDELIVAHLPRLLGASLRIDADAIGLGSSLIEDPRGFRLGFLQDPRGLFVGSPDHLGEAFRQPAVPVVVGHGFGSRHERRVPGRRSALLVDRGTRPRGLGVGLHPRLAELLFERLPPAMTRAGGSRGPGQGRSRDARWRTRGDGSAPRWAGVADRGRCSSGEPPVPWGHAIFGARHGGCNDPPSPNAARRSQRTPPHDGGPP